jgi:hypothetical protein
MGKLKLLDITLICADCLHYEQAEKAIKKSCEQIEFSKVLFFTDKDIKSDVFETVNIKKLTSSEAYSIFIFKELNKYVNTKFVLIIQWDGFIINPNLFDSRFLFFDYIGAPWWYNNFNVGNGGFSLRSKKLLEALQDKCFVNIHPEDDRICRLYRTILENKYKIKFCPESLASKFSFEPNGKYFNYKYDTFGFHGESVIIELEKRKMI